MYYYYYYCYFYYYYYYYYYYYFYYEIRGIKILDFFSLLLSFTYLLYEVQVNITQFFTDNILTILP